MPQQKLAARSSSVSPSPSPSCLSFEIESQPVCRMKTLVIGMPKLVGKVRMIHPVVGGNTPDGGRFK